MERSFSKTLEIVADLCLFEKNTMQEKNSFSTYGNFVYENNFWQITVNIFNSSDYLHASVF